MLSLVVVCQGCATIVHLGGKQDVHITTDPPGATAYASGKSITTPGTLTLPRDENHTIYVRKEGFEEKHFYIDSDSSYWMWGNAVFLYAALITVPIDVWSGGGYYLEPDKLSVVLHHPDLSDVAAEGDADTVRLLLNKGIDVNIKGYNGETALITASRTGKIEIVKTLLKKGADVNAQNNNGVTALMVASYHGYIKIVRTLLDNNAEVNVKDLDRETALMKATFRGNLDSVQALLERDIDVNAQDINGETALMKAALNADIDSVQALLEKGADVNKKTNSGWTALMSAAKSGQSNIVKALLVKGADVNAETKKSLTASKIAAEFGHDKIVKLLKIIEDEEINKWVSRWQVSKVAPISPTTPPSAYPLTEKQNEYTKISGDRWAVIIGISTYQDTRIPALRYASADAQAFYDWIVSPDGGKYAPSRVKLLIDQDATGSNIKNALFTWLTQAIAEDIVTIYFAGHGSPNDPESPDNLFLSNITT